VSAGTPAVVPAHALRIERRRVTAALALAVIALIAIHLAFQLYRSGGHAVPWDLHLLFDVEEEPSIPTWFAEFQLLVASGLALLAGGAARRSGSRGARHWMALAAGLALVSLDKTACFHELFMLYTEIEWTTVRLFVLAALVIAYAPFVLRLPARTRGAVTMAALVYLCGAIGVPALAGSILPQAAPGALAEKAFAAAEAGLQMAGTLMFIRALLGHLGGDGNSPIEIEVEVGD
jgi:hypothetical protein